MCVSTDSCIASVRAGFSSKAYQDLPPQLRMSATSNGEQRVRVRVPNAQGLHRTTQSLMQEYLNLVDWKGLELLSTERRCKASVKKFERSPTVACIRLGSI